MWYKNNDLAQEEKIKIFNFLESNSSIKKELYIGGTIYDFNGQEVCLIGASSKNSEGVQLFLSVNGNIYSNSRNWQDINVKIFS